MLERLRLFFCGLLLDLSAHQLPHNQDFKEKHINIPCPYCKETLFRARPHIASLHILGLAIPDNATATHDTAIPKDDPGIQHTEGEYYAICPKCGKRVLMELVPGGPSGTSFRVSPNQS